MTTSSLTYEEIKAVHTEAKLSSIKYYINCIINKFEYKNNISTEYDDNLNSFIEILRNISELF